MASRNVKVLPKIIGNILGTKVLAIPFPILFLKKYWQQRGDTSQSIANSIAILLVLQY